jgi:diadenosine tetraphosphatase ApaH/serine/threonine PP2A family protein phosphatase
MLPEDGPKRTDFDRRTERIDALLRFLTTFAPTVGHSPGEYWPDPRDRALRPVDGCVSARDMAVVEAFAAVRRIAMET